MKSYDLGGPNFGLNVVGALDLDVESTSETYQSSDLGVGVLASLKGLEWSCPSSEGRENYQLRHIWRNIKRPPTKDAKFTSDNKAER